MAKLVKLDPNKVIYDGTSFVTVYTEEQLLKKFKALQDQLKKDFDDLENSNEK